MHDVATVADGSIPQTNIVRQDGKRGVLVTVLKSGSASTLDVVAGIRGIIPRIKLTLPPALTITPSAISPSSSADRSTASSAKPSSPPSSPA